MHRVRFVETNHLFFFKKERKQFLSSGLLVYFEYKKIKIISRKKIVGLFEFYHVAQHIVL